MCPGMTVALLVFFGKVDVLTGKSLDIWDGLIVWEIGDTVCAVVNCCEEKLVF